MDIVDIELDWNVGLGVYFEGNQFDCRREAMVALKENLLGDPQAVMFGSRLKGFLISCEVGRRTLQPLVVAWLNVGTC